MLISTWKFKKGGRMTKEWVFIIFLIVVFLFVVIPIFIRKIFGGITAQEKLEEKRLRKRQIEESIPQIVDSVSLWG
jgi:biopolymer transport protein ExbB/TolQ